MPVATTPRRRAHTRAVSPTAFVIAVLLVTAPSIFVAPIPPHPAPRDADASTVSVLLPTSAVLPSALLTSTIPVLLPAALNRAAFVNDPGPAPRPSSVPSPSAPVPSPSPIRSPDPSPSPPRPSPSPSPSPSPPPSPLPSGDEHFVSATATGSGDGSFANPWTLQAALDHPAALAPGDTVWLRGGTYSATAVVDPALGAISFVCRTHGTADAPIVFRNYRDERATIDGLDDAIVLFVSDCPHTWFWGLEVMSSAPVRSPSRAYVYVTAPDVKFINMVLHDMADGIDLWTAAVNAELYGSIIYHNGWDETNGGHGHGIYTQNKPPGTKTIHDNVFFSQYGFNLKVWSTNQSIDNYDLQGNIAFNGGSLSEYASRKFNFYVVGNNPDAIPRNIRATHNYTYAGRSTTSPPCNTFGPNYGVVDLTLEHNYLLGQLRVAGPYVTSSIAHNTILGGTELPFLTGPDFRVEDYPDNVYSQEVPTEGFEAFVRPNRYEPGRANIAVYNWGGADIVPVDVGGTGLRPGDRYELVNVMDYYEDIVEGTLGDDRIIPVPMTGHTFAQAIGSTKPPVSQFPFFGAFVVRRAWSSDHDSSSTGRCCGIMTPMPPIPTGADRD